MKWFRNMNIGKKLTGSFLMVAFIAGIVGTFGISNLLKIDRLYTSLFENFGIGLGYIGQASIAYQRTRVNLRDLILDKGSADRSKYVSTIEEMDKILEEELAKFEQTIETEDVRKEFEDLLAAIEAFKPV